MSASTGEDAIREWPLGELRVFHHGAATPLLFDVTACYRVQASNARPLRRAVPLYKLAAVLALLRRLSKAVGRIKRSVQSGWEVPFESGLAIERELQQQLFQSDDAKEGLAAYIEKRKPEFEGV